MPVRTEVAMGTLVTIHVVRAKTGSDAAAVDAAIDRAFAWFHRIEACCTRFRADSELMQLTTQIGVPVPVSAMLFEAVRFALTTAEESGGAFDPTVGGAMEARGFNSEHRTRQVFRSPAPADGHASYRDVELDPERETILLGRPLTLDLGGVAKGLAVDTAARELEPFRDFAIDAGGDLYLGGLNPRGKPWAVGIRHPRRDGETIDTLRVSNRAVCTSGDYERAAAHILDPRNGAAAESVASATVVGPGAMLADALATAAFVLGPESGIALLERLGVEGLIVTPRLQQYRTGGFGDVA
jgi:thiamine biosynthesis lipoprotein